MASPPVVTQPLNPALTVDPEKCPSVCCGCLIDRPHIGLDEFAECLCFPLGSPSRSHFWQLGQNASSLTRIDPNTPASDILAIDTFSPCDWIVFNHTDHGHQTMGRDELWRYIYDASRTFIRTFHERVGYYPIPTQECYEYNAPRRRFQFGNELANWVAMRHCICTGREGNGHVLQLPSKKIRQLGKEKYDFVEDRTVAPTSYVDADGDGILDSVEFMILNDGKFTSFDEVRVHFHASQSHYEDLYRNEIRPVRVRKDPNNTLSPDPTKPTWIITIPARLAVQPVKYIQRQNTYYDPNDRSIYATIFKIYRQWVDTSQGVTIMRKQHAQCGCKCVCNSNIQMDSQSPDGCYMCHQARACMINAECGLVEVFARSQDACSVCEMCVDKLCIHYMSGDCLDIRCVIANYAASLMRRMICCKDNSCLEEMRADYIGVSVSEFGRASGFTALTPGERLITNILGSRHGGVLAARFIRQYMGDRDFVGVILY